jgi:tRNA threonylcarbamoyladenosine biosynthesis protein TsaE
MREERVDDFTHHVPRFMLYSSCNAAYNDPVMPILAPNSLEIISRSPEQTKRVGMRLGGLLQPGDTLSLVGDLGSGKTTLVQGLVSGWGSLDAVSSPTFVLVNVYRRHEGKRFFHMDAYRLSGPAEAEDLDIEAMLTAGPLVVEWADRVQQALPSEHLWATLKYIDESQRDLLFVAHGKRPQALLAALRMKVFGG